MAPAANPSSDRVAVMDLGSNTTRLLIADVRDGEVTELDRRTEITASKYREAIDAADVGRTVAIATSAVRDAANGEELRARLREKLDLEVETISGEEEARLTFVGATTRRAPEAD